MGSKNESKLREQIKKEGLTADIINYFGSTIVFHAAPYWYNASLTKTGQLKAHSIRVNCLD